MQTQLLNYHATLQSLINRGDANEHSFRTAFEVLLNAFKPTPQTRANTPTQSPSSEQGEIVIIHEPKAKQGQGSIRPDFKITRQMPQNLQNPKTQNPQNPLKNNVGYESLIGFIGCKNYGENLTPLIKGKQIEKYLTVCHNIILTDYNRFILLSYGEVKADLTLFPNGVEANLLNATQRDSKNAQATQKAQLIDISTRFSQLLGEFFHTSAQIAQKDELIKVLSTQSFYLSTAIFSTFGAQNQDLDFHTTFEKSYQSFRDLESADISVVEFCDIVAQSIVYGAFVAHIESETYGIDKIPPEMFCAILPKHFITLREFIESSLPARNLPDSIAYALSNIIKTIALIDKPSIATSFQKEISEVSIYLYEDFLKAYDELRGEQKRKEGGVFYTPEPIVNMIVRSINELLQKHFGKSFSDERVKVLDFATGTGSFLAKVFEAILEDISEIFAKNTIINKCFRDIYGFEMSFVPYIVAHLKLSQILRERGFSDFSAHQKFQVYLTNTLDLDASRQIHLQVPFDSLKNERDKSLELKHKENLLVILGNPPYNVKSKNKGKEILQLLDSYKMGLNETKINLDDDYIKFIRFAQWKLIEQKQQQGIMGFITNNSFLSGRTHRKMRESLAKSFDEIYILNLNGDSGEDKNDKNVFDIRVGVCISLFVKYEKSTHPLAPSAREGEQNSVPKSPLPQHEGDLGVGNPSLRENPQDSRGNPKSCHTNTTFCHTERSEVSKNKSVDSLDSSLVSLAQNDNKISPSLAEGDKGGGCKSLAQIHYFSTKDADILRRADKFALLNDIANNGLDSIQWQVLNLDAPYFWFVPKDFSNAEYKNFWALAKDKALDESKGIFELYGSANSALRDNVCIQFDKENVLKTLYDFIHLEAKEIRSKYRLPEKDSRDWSVARAKADIIANVDCHENSSEFSRNDTHPLAPSAREGESSETLSTREGASQNAHLVFDGHINTSGSLSAENANIALQGHASTHATISDSKIREQIKNAENGTSKAMPDYMDLSKPSTLNQPDWDTRYFKFSNGIELKGANLTLGRNAYLESNISADSSSSIAFGGGVKHFIDNKDSANINGEGFGYYQKVESGNLSAEMQNLANQSTHYKGKITADGTTINSSIFDFNASLDLKNNAKLNAEYLTLTSTDSVTLANGASATIQNLVLKNVSDLNGKFSVSGSGTKFEVQKSFQFENSNFDLSKLDSTTGLSATQNYDIVGVKSTITGTTKDLSANVELYDSASLSLKNLTLKNVDTNNKNLVYLQGGDSQTSNTKLSLSENLQAQNLDKAQIILWGKSEISTPKIEFSSVKEGVLLLDSEAKLTNTQNANVEVKGVDSGLNIFISGNHNFNINASGANTSVTLNAIPSDFSPAPENKPSENAQKPSFSGKISARDSSIVTTALESITASVDLSGNASLVAKNITLDSTHNSIDLKGTSSLNADTISAKNLTNLTLNLADNASASVSKFIFDGGENGTTTNLVGNLIGTNIELKNASIVKAGDLHFKNKGEKTTLTLDNTSKLEANTLKIDSTNLWLNLADSATNTASLQNIDLQGGANLHINAWDFGNNTIFKSADNSRVIFHNATYTQNSTPKSFSAATTISGTLSLTNVGSDSSKTDDRFNALTFSENLSFGESAKIMVNLDSSIYKNSDKAPTLDTYYTLLGAKSILDNRADKRIDFIFDSAVSEDKQFFVVSKFFDNELRIKFLESNPRSFSELNKHISSANSKILQALSEHNPHNENIDIAARTEEYAQLESFLSKQQETMSQIAKQASGENLTLMLQNNDLSMRLRVMQALFASSQNNEQYAQNHIKQKPILLAKNSKIKPYNATKSDYISTSDGLDSSFYLGGVPKPPKISNANLYKNNAWASALGGYVGTSGVHNAFYGSSVGYDRIINKTLLGVMASFGGHTLLQSQSKQNGIIASGGVYLHTVFSKSEFSSSLSYTFSALESNILGDTIKSSVYGGFWSNYYKYNVGLLNGHILKPLIAISIGANKASDWRGKEFRGGGFSDVFSNIGAGLEYMLTNKRGFYTLGLVGFFKIHSQSKAQISFANAKTMLDVVVNHNAFETQGYFIGSHSLGSYALQQRATLEYGIYASIDGRGYYGVKGNVVFKYAF